MSWYALMTMGLLALPLRVCYTDKAGCTLESRKETGHHLDGDILIGGIIPIHWNWKDPETTFRAAPEPILCHNFSLLTYTWARAIDFAVDEINQDPTFLPNVTLGVRIYDSCLSLARSLKGITWLLAEGEDGLLNYRYQEKSPLAAVIADSGTTKSIAIGRWLGLHRYPQISYFASSTALSDKRQYPSFFRTIPSDDFQARGLAQLVLQFGWSWVGILFTDNDYGQLGSQTLKEDLSKFGVCVAFSEAVPLVEQANKIDRIVEKVTKSTATAILVFSSDPYICPVLAKLSRLNGTRKIWLASEGWSTSPIVSSLELADMLSGTIGFAIHQGAMPGFTEFLLRLQPPSYSHDPFLKLLWEHAFKCKWPNANELNVLKETTNDLCTGNENLTMFSDSYFSESDFRISYNIYNAVYATAHALSDMRSCVPGNGPFINNTCANIWKLRPWELLHYVRRVRFKNKHGEEMSFDNHGNPPAFYDIVNWQKDSKGTIHYVKVGSFKSRAADGHELVINTSAIRWHLKTTEVPRSACSESCVPGYRKAGRKGQPPCCYDCVPCAEGEISNETDVTKCRVCPKDQWPDEIRSHCVLKQIEFLTTYEFLAIALALVSISCSVKTIIILVIFIKYAHTAVVKANNRELSYLLLGALALSFLCSFLFIGEPQSIKCLLRQPAFGITFVLCVSCVLAKTIMVVIAFNATKPGSNMRRWLGPRVPAVTVSLCTLLQVIICATWLVTCPPFPEKNMTLKTGIIIFKCNECSEPAFWAMLGYMGFLACASFLVAFLARKLPDSFNEAKWITFSMLVFLSVWLSFVPGYLSTQGKYMVAVEIFCIISSSTGLLICIFLPKCWFILLRPDLNNREHLLRKGH